MSDFEDPELQRMLGRAGGNYPDVNVAFEQLQGRVRHAKRRRVVVVSGAACSLLFGVAVLAANRIGDSAPAQIGDRDTLDVSFPDDTTDDRTPNTTDDSDHDSLPGTDGAGGTPGVTTHTTIHDTTHDTTDDTTHDTTHDGGDDGDSGDGDGDGSNPPTTTDSSPTTSVFSGIGGTITVRLQGGTLTLVSDSATSGFSLEIDQAGGDRVEVRFESSNHRTRIRIDLENNAMVPSVEETET